MIYSNLIGQYQKLSFRSSIRDNYNTSTKDHFKESRGASGTEPLPPSIYKAGSGFITGTVNTLPLQREVQNRFMPNFYFVNPNFLFFVASHTRTSNIVTNQVTDVHADTRRNFKTQHRSLLFDLQRKDPVEQENNGVVGFLTTSFYFQ